MEDQATPSVILKYKTRRFAETAMSSGKIRDKGTVSAIISDPLM